jgi:glucokinase
LEKSYSAFTSQSKAVGVLFHSASNSTAPRLYRSVCLPIWRSFPVCCSSGCYERYASTTALVARAEAATGLHRNGLEIFRDAGAGDETLLRVLDAWLDDVAAGLRGLAHIFNPSLILIGGGVSAQKTLLMDPLRAKVLSGIMPRFSEHLRIEPAALGNDAGLLGALKFFLDSPS